MKKLSILLLLMFLSFFTIEANATSVSNGSYRVKTIELEKWDQSSRSAMLNPIECYLMDTYIEVRFIGSLEMPVTLQIKDAYGNIVYQNMEINCQQGILKIEIDYLKSGLYEFNYSDEEIALKGKFEIE